MLILPQKVNIKWNNNNKKRLIDKGYEFTKIHSELEIDIFDLSPNSTISIQVICDFCGNKILKAFREYNKSKKDGSTSDACMECKSIKGAKKRTKYSFEEVKTEFEKKDYILLEEEYLGYKIPHRYICNKGHEDKLTIKSLLKGYGCKMCSIQKNAERLRKSIEEVRKIFKENDCILLSNDYKNIRQNLDYLCECGNQDTINLENFMRGHRCSYCRSEKLRNANLKYDIEFVKRVFKENNCVLLNDTYVSSNDNLRYICACGNESKIKLHAFINGRRCRNCFIDRNRGKNHSRWNHTLTKEERDW